MIALFLIPVALVAYMLGSIPFGLILTRAVGLGDVRTIGSGNIGATNVLRTGRKDIAAATLVLDAAKAAAAVLAGRFLAGEAGAATAAVCAFLGHCFPIWLDFRGGKGVATFIGAALALAWPLGLALIGIWLLAAAIFGYSSLAALIMVGLAPLLALGAWEIPAAVALALLAPLLFRRHTENIRRLRAGTEAKIGKKD